MKLTNYQIYTYATRLSNVNINDIRMPVRIGFFLQKNISLLISAGQEIEQARMNLAYTFGSLNDDQTQFIVPPDRLVEANQELSDLFNLTQELDIHVFKLDEFDNIDLTYDQMSAIMFMIEE